MLKLLLIFTVLSLSAGQFATILKSGESAVYLFDLIVSIFSIYGALWFFGVKKTFKIPKNSLFFIFFSFVGLLSLVRVLPFYSSFEMVVSFLYLLRWIMYLVAGLVVYNMILCRTISFGFLLKLFAISGVVVAMLGFVQLLLLPDFTVLEESLGWDPHKNRLASTFFDPNFTGAYLSLVFATLIKKKGNVLVGLILLAAIFLTFSRSAWLLLSAIILVYGVFKYRALLVLFAIVSFSAYYAVPRVQTRLAGTTDPADSAHFRIISWSDAYKVFKDNKLLGVGFNTYRFAQKDYNMLTPDDYLSHSGAGADASLLFILATTGILGFTFLAGGLGFSLYKYLKERNVLMISIVLGLLGNSVFINSVFYPPIMFFWIVLLFSCSYART